MRYTLLLVAGVSGLCLTQPARVHAQVARLLPVDEAANRPDFFTFRARLLQATQARDTAFLHSIVAPDILTSFGGDGGVAEFRERWRPEQPDSELWTVLTEILSLGGAFLGDGSFIAPYTSSSFPSGIDSYDHVAIVGSNVAVRQQPAASATLLATLSFDIVARAEPPAGHTSTEWITVQLADGRRGFVAARYVRSPSGYRAGFVQRDGRWLLRYFIAGD